MVYERFHNESGTPLPLLMNFTSPTKIQTAEEEATVLYDQISQQIPYIAMAKNTKCRVSKNTKLSPTRTNTDTVLAADDVGS